LIECIDITGSTNADLVFRLAAGGPVFAGSWLVALRQTAGRGRLGRVWDDGAGNFMGSTVHFPRAEDPPLASLALVVGLAVQRVVSDILPLPYQAQLKWPNDVMVGDAKLAGILLERAGEALVIGVGVNIAQAPDLPERATVALSRFGSVPGVEEFASRLASSFASELELWRNYGLAAMLQRWLAVAYPLGTAMSVKGLNGTITGHFAGLDESGALQLALPDGRLHIVHAGDVQLL
jgi:BirA family biotin operon repressor/biotin-[acetyl-CoA-carboxylase] ligase